MSKTKRISFKEKYDMYKAGYQFSAEELNEQTDEKIYMSPVTQDVGGNTFLFWMIRNKDDEVPEFIEKYGKIIDINIRNNEGWPPLILSVRNSRIETVKALIKVGADVNVQNIKGWTALMHVSRYNDTDSNIEIVKILMKEGADVNLSLDGGWTALMLSKDPKITEVLIQAGASYTENFKISVTADRFKELLKTEEIVNDMVKYAPGNNGYKEVEEHFKEKSECL